MFQSSWSTARGSRSGAFCPVTNGCNGLSFAASVGSTYRSWVLAAFFHASQLLQTGNQTSRQGFPQGIRPDGGMLPGNWWSTLRPQISWSSADLNPWTMSPMIGPQRTDGGSATASAQMMTSPLA